MLVTLLGPVGWAQAQSGGLSVSDSGMPSYSVPIGVPPGIAGMEPKLGLGYSGVGINGPVGVGWSVQGYSTITRCASIPAIDAGRVPVKFTATDRLCLDGVRLIQVTANAANDGSFTAVATSSNNDASGVTSTTGCLCVEYRTATDQFARIRAFSLAGSAANGPSYFKVWTKSGLVYEYGNPTDPYGNASNAQILTATGGAVMVWAVDKIADTLGNFMLFKYNVNLAASWGSGSTAGSPQVGTEWNLAEVWYTGTASQAPSNKVVFTYAPRTSTPAHGTLTASPTGDGSEAYQAGHKNVDTQLLQYVTTYLNVTTPMTLGSVSGGTMVKYYKLTWTTGPTTYRYLLQQVAECSGAATPAAVMACLPPTIFSYSTPPTAPTNYVAASKYNLGSFLEMMDPANASGGHAYGILTGNFMGTGRTDIIRWNDTPSNNQLWTSNGDGSFGGSSSTKNASFNITGAGQYLGRSDGCYGSFAMDFNSDGLTDIVAYENPTGVNGACPTPITNVLYINTGNGIFNQVAIPSTISLSQIRATAGSFLCIVNNTKYAVPTWSNGATFYVLDVNGDGYQDLVTTTLTTGGTPAGYPCGVPPTGATQVYLGSPSGTNSYSFTQVTTTNVQNVSLYSDPPSGLAYSIPTLDMNGDGYVDLNLGPTNSKAAVSGIWLSNGDGNFTSVGGGISCSQAVDFNGDGKPDCLSLFYNTTNATYENNLFVFNDTLSPFPISQFSSLQGAALSPTGTTNNLGISVPDINGDGRGDILVWSDSPSNNAIYLSNGDGSFNNTATNLTSWQLRKSDNSADFALGDFTGHGSPELLLLSATSTGWSSTLLVQQDWPVAPSKLPPDLLISVASPTGVVTKLSWLPLASSKDSGGVVHYTPDAGTSNPAVYPAVDLSPAVWMVTSSTSDTGVGATGSVLYDTTNYFYTGLKANIKGRGVLGFRQVARTNPGADGTNLTVTTNYVQSYPFIGLAANTATTVASTGAVLSQTWNQYCDMTSTGALPTIGVSEVQGTALPACASSSALVSQPYLLASYETGKDLNGAALPDSLTTNVHSLENGHPNMGDPTAIVTVTGTNTSGSGGALNQSFTKTVTNTYQTADSSGSNWVLGRLTNATVQNTISATSTVSASAGTGRNAADVAGTATALTVSVMAPATATAAVQTGTAISTTPVPIKVTVYPTAPLSYAVTRVSTGTTDITASVNTTVSPATVTFSSSVLAPGTSATETFQVQTVDSTGRTGVTGSGASSANVVVTIGNSVSSTATFTGVSGTGAGSSSAGASGSNLTGSVWENNGLLANAYTLSFRNDGNAAMTLTGLAFSGTISTVFSVGANTCTAIAVGASCTIGVTVNSKLAFGGYSGTWATVGANTNAGGNFAETIYAVVAQWGSSTAAQTLSFGSQTVGTSSAAQNIALNNLGNAAAAWTGLANLPAGFSATLSGCSSVAGGGSCTVSITFTPTAALAYGGTNNISPNPAATINNNYLTVTGTGTGTRKAAPIPISSSTANYTLNPSKVAGYVAGYTDVTLSVNATVYSATPATPALTVSGFAAGDTVTLTGAGNIYGGGGLGGTTAANTSSPTGAGGTGGDALSLSFTVTFNGFTGVLAGGGGGGGSGGLGEWSPRSGYTDAAGGGGGGGGAGYNVGSGGAGQTVTIGTFINYGGAAGVAPSGPSNMGGGAGGAGGQNSGSGGAGGAVGVAGNSGAAATLGGGGGGGGGGLGAPGGSGGNGGGSISHGTGGGGGSAGYAIRKNGNAVGGPIPTHYGTVN